MGIGHQRILILAIFVGVFCTALQGNTQSKNLPLKVRLTKTNSKKPIRWAKGKAVLRTLQVKPNVRHLKSQVLIRVSKKIKLKSVFSDNNSAEIKLKSNRILLETDAMTTDLELNLKNGKTIGLRVKLSGFKNGLRVSGCEDLNLNYQSLTEKLPFYKEVQCVKTGDRNFLQMSFPEELRLVESALVEKDGKGESWRLFDLGQLLGARENLTEFTFSFKGKSYVFRIVSTLKGQVQQEMVKNNYSIGIGYNTTSISGAIDADAGAPLFVAQGLPRKLWGNAQLGLDIFATIPSDAEESISFLQLSPYLLYEFNKTGSFHIAPVVAMSFSSQTESPSDLSYQLTQAGAGLRLGFNLSTNWKAWTTFRVESFGDETIDSHSSIHIQILNRGEIKTIGYGGGVVLQSISVVDSNGDASDFVNTSAYFTINF